MNRLSLLKTTNIACALLQGLGFWLLTLSSAPYLRENPWTQQLLPMAAFYAVVLPLAAAFFNRALLPAVARRRYFYSAAFCFVAVYGYLVMVGYTLFEKLLDKVGYERPLLEIAQYALGYTLWAAILSVPLWILFSLGLGFTFSRLYAKRDYLPEAV
jgi:hypothetical protein